MDYPVFIRRGDARAELQRILGRLRAADAAVSDAALGLHKAMYVTRAEQTVVMVSAADSPLADALRAAGGWAEPGRM